MKEEERAHHLLQQVRPVVTTTQMLQLVQHDGVHFFGLQILQAPGGQYHSRSAETDCSRNVHGIGDAERYRPGSTKFCDLILEGGVERLRIDRAAC